MTRMPAKPLPWSASDERFMRRALRLAQRGLGRVEPNPMVGCVLVKNGRVIGEGYHHYFGGPHAEVDALAKTTSSPTGATAFVTLEPCSYFGKTPPCVDALLRARVGRVVAAVLDPNPRVNGVGAAKLRKAGVRVDVGLLEREAREMNAPFFKQIRTGLPWVIVKWAQSVDGKIATERGESKWISDETARAHAHRVRGRVGAILVGSQTVIADDPQLTCRVGRARRKAARVVLDARLRIPLSARLVRDKAAPTWIFTSREAANSRRAKALRDTGCEVIAAPMAKGGGISLPRVLGMLTKRGVGTLLVEGGGALLSSFLSGGFADEAHIYIAPLFIGGSSAPAPLATHGAQRVAEAMRLRAPSLRAMGNGWFLQARLSE